MPISAKNLAPNRQRVLTFVSPSVEDILFVETVDAQRVGADIPEYGTPHPDTKRWPDHELVLVKTADEQGLFYQYFYAARREAQDDYNFQYGEASMGGRSFPVVERIYVIPREDFDPVSPASGAPMPTGPDEKFDGLNYVLMDRVQQDADEALRSLYVIEKRTYVQKYTAVTIGVDDLNGKPLHQETRFYYADEVVVTTPTTLTASQLFAAPTNAYWGLQTDGYERTGQQLSDDWYVVDRKQVVAVTLSGGIATIHDYFTTEDFFWPAVLGGVRVYSYTLKEGGNENYAEPWFSKEAYRGPCKARVEVTWSPAEFTVGAPNVMAPLPIAVNTPFYSWSVGPCLHSAGTITIFTGSDHPKYDLNTGIAAEWSDTTPTDWDPSVVASDEQRPFRGGFLRTKVTIYQPSFT